MTNRMRSILSMVVAALPALAIPVDTIHLVVTNNSFAPVVLSDFTSECWIEGDKDRCSITCGGPYTVPVGAQNVSICSYQVEATIDEPMTGYLYFNATLGSAPAVAQTIWVTDPPVGACYGGADGFAAYSSFSHTGSGSYQNTGTYVSPFTAAPTSVAACTVVPIQVQYAVNTVTCAGPQGTVCAGNCQGRQASCSFNLYVPPITSPAEVTVSDGTSSVTIAVAVGQGCAP